uniref:Uncharacterized protein n=1 Tax=Panagrolaimus sp. PS1159 TaxID=55785 RepID=A0AC35GK90_9BILA
MLFPKSVTPVSTAEISNSTSPANETRNSTTLKPANKTEEASFPLLAIILICCIAGILLITGLAFAIFCLIKKRKKKAENLSISELERRILAKKPKKNEMDKNHEIVPEKKVAKKAENKVEKKAKKKAGKKDEKKKTEEFSLPTAAFPSSPNVQSQKERNASAKQKIEKILQRR